MAKFKWVKEGIDEIDSVGSMLTVLSTTTVRAALVTDSPLTFDWDWNASSLTKATGTGFTPIDVSLSWSGPWHDTPNQCVYRKSPANTWANGTGDAVTVTGLEVYDTADGGTLLGVVVFDDEEVLNAGDAIEIDIFAGIGTCDPDSIVTVMEA